MPFKQTFEQNLNDEMQGDGQPGRAPSDMEDVDLDIKKVAFSPEEFNDSKEQPPRFSTLYGVAPKKASVPVPPPPPPPASPRVYDYPRDYYGPLPRSRRSGVTIPMPLFIVFAVILAFESTILFAYTVIGLYNNAPSRIFPWAGPGTATAVCNPGEQKPSINFAPNFMLPQADKANVEASVQTVTVSATPSTTTVSATASTVTVSATGSTTSSTTTSSSTSTSSTTDTAAAASGILGMLGGLGTSASTTSGDIAVTTVGPTQSTVTSIKLVTKDPSGKVISDPMVTLTSVKVVPASSSTTGSITSRAKASTFATVTSAASETGQSASQGVVGGWAAVSSVLEDADSSSASATASSS